MYKLTILGIFAVLLAVFTSAQPATQPADPQSETMLRRRIHRCYVGGCYGKTCSDRSIYWTYDCDYDELYDCFRFARCQYDLYAQQCDWTYTEKYRDCVREVREYKAALARGENPERPESVLGPRNP